MRCNRSPKRPNGADIALRPLDTLGSLSASGSCCASRTLGSSCPGCPGRSRWTLWTIGTRFALLTLLAWRTLGSLDSVDSLRTLGTFGSFGSGFASWTLRSGSTGGSDWPSRTACSLRTCCSLRTWGPFRSSRSEHGDVSVIANNVNDKIRYGERGEEEIAQTLTSRCSMRG
jgi:hypothetical protein